MVSDSITPNASIPSAPKDMGKKKRANRSAKLKQCKLDARREQWLSQGAVKNKGCKEEPVRLPCEKERGKNRLENLGTRRRETEGGVRVGEEENENRSIHHHDFDSDSASNSPISSSSVLGGGGTDSGTNFTCSSGSSSSSSSSSSSGGCCSGNITEVEDEDDDGDNDDNCLDDWEAMADALAANDNNNNKRQENQNGNPGFEPDSSPESEQVPVGVESNLGNLDLGCENSKQEQCSRSRLAPGNSRAWRPDDVSRPQNLPNLSKQRSLPNTDRHYGQGGGGGGGGRIPWACVSAVNVPSSCPICCEELDFTDTSFLPCLCGFRLCLFCHKRILEEDGRCPGCRKPYEHDHVEAEASVNGGSLTFRLARSCSMIARS